MIDHGVYGERQTGVTMIPYRVSSAWLRCQSLFFPFPPQTPTCTGLSHLAHCQKPSHVKIGLQTADDWAREHKTKTIGLQIADG